MTTIPEFNEADLLELPSTGDYQLSQAVPEDTPVWTAESVRTYALAAVAASRKKLMQQKPVFEVGFGWLDDATKYPRGTKLFAAPMPKANESDAVAAPPCVLTYDEDTDAWDSACGEKLFFDEGGPAENGMRFCYACGKKITARAVLAGEPLPQPDGPTQEQETILQKLTDEAQAMGLYDAQPVQDEPCCANPRPDCMGMLLSGIGNRCAALAQAQASGQAAPSVGDLAAFYDSQSWPTPEAYSSALLSRYGQAPAAGTEPYGWLYDWTHSSATGRPDEIHTSFTTDEGRARTGVGHTNVRAVCLATPVAAQAAQPDAYLMARRLAISLHAKHYATEAPEWKPLGDLAGVLTQIDNMTTGLVCAQAPAAVPLDDSSLLSDIEDWLSDLRQANHTGYVPQNVFTEAGYFVERIEVLRAAAPTPPASAAPALDRNAIIEECAKVAEGARDGSRSHLFRSAGTTIAGNIRALKDPENCNE